MAKAILTLAAAGAPVPEVLADELARGVLADQTVVLARQVAEGGPHKLLRAIELAEAVLRDVKEEAAGPLRKVGTAATLERMSR